MNQDMTLDSPFAQICEEESIGTLKLLTGSDVLTCLCSQDFLEKWDHLYQSCPWSTVFQSPAFVSTWYNLYQDAYLPVMIMSESNSNLTGLISLALPKSKRKGKKHFIVGAGHHEADYQTWLADESDGDQFILGALTELRKRFPNNELMLRHLPPNTPLDWINDNPSWKSKCVLQSFKRPLVVFKDFSISRRDRKRISRLKDKSNFEQILNDTDFASLLDEIAANYDFRQGAMFNKYPFRNDAQNAAFLLALYRQKLLHLTVLRNAQGIVASVAALIGKNRAHLGGINFHSPHYASYSPGFVHFLLLSQQLAGQGYEYFDLTPGGDSYKDRLATEHDVVHVLVTTKSKLYYYKRWIRKSIYDYLMRSGIRPMTLELLLKKKLYLIKEKGLGSLLADRVRNYLPKRQQKLYTFNVRHITAKPACFIKQNSLHDLLNYEFNGKGPTKWEFLEAAMHRLELGEQVYTASQEGVLQACIWLRKNPAATHTDNMKIPTGALLLYGIYYHPHHLHSLADFLSNVTLEVATGTDEKLLYALLDVNDKTLEAVLKDAGFDAIETQC
ncbi:GNAT family N-acetyltransferase [Pontibacter sp. JH31]|uniref:GNAT family N-acetyltransferase n=1 Tax=Pontibacter aquaedesilientis TaxID=2766980 RepID=A0ABR7XHG0_9BACT|nr:GNAT family N-acetyltransferase [Pontibacter aquaedesilientis]MBD1397720.1 GNAT family N-acetyltransferase [Pontibacter aquaedesilientis]